MSYQVANTPKHTHIWWWPASVYVEDFVHLVLDEIETQQHTHITAIAPQATQSHVCYSSHTDPGSTSYDQDATSLLVISPMNDFTEDDSTSLMHMPDPHADRSRSDGESDPHSSRSSNAPTSDVNSPDSSEEEASDALVVYGRNIEAEIIPIDVGASIDLYRLLAGHHFRIDPGSDAWHAFSIYHVRPKPSDLAPCIIPLLATFQGEKEKDTSIALIDIELRTNSPPTCDDENTDPYLLRESWYLPSSLTRAAFIHWIGLKQLCNRDTAPCVTQYGYHPWMEQDAMPMPIPDGIYLRIIVPVSHLHMPLPFYVTYSRAQVPYARMYEHWQREQREVAARLRNMFDTDDEHLQEAIRPTEPTIEEPDFSGMLQHCSTCNGQSCHTAVSPEEPDVSSLMQMDVTRAPGVSCMHARQLIVI